MRSWRIFNRDQSGGSNGVPASNSSDSGDIDEINDRPPGATGGSTVRSADGFIGFRSRQRHDARAERSIALSARNLGDGVQLIVSAAKVRENNDGAWKQDLLNLLESKDVETLLENANNEKFVLRCVENELPPNLVHCLRLLRVLELQHANNNGEASEGGETEIKSIGEEAAKKVSRLLCLSCKDASVGEQLRPHLFGLFALSGASYPPTGVHVAKAASDVICAFAEHCLTRQLVWFIHDRKMILHMTDDIRELAGMGESAAAASVPNGLVGNQAEEAGLLVLSFRTLITLVFFSCRRQSNELVNDFNGAGGFDLYYGAITQASPDHTKSLLELLPNLLCCPEELSPDYNAEMGKLVSNSKAFDVLRKILLDSNLLLQAYKTAHPDETLDPSTDGVLPLLARLSIEKGIQARVGGYAEQPRPDIANELLGLALPMFSDHPNNYDRLEGQEHMLSFYVLALPCFADEDLKEFVLKTLEFVLTAVGVGREVTPVHACVEVFFSMCLALLNPEESLPDVGNQAEAVAVLTRDMNQVGASFEKLLQFDERVAPTVMESGILTSNLKSVLELLTTLSPNAGEKSLPYSGTPFDATFSTICRVLKLLVASRPQGFGEESDAMTNLYRLLHTATFDLGLEGCFAACSVFETFLSSCVDKQEVKRDMLFILDLVHEVADTVVDADPQRLASTLQRVNALVGTIRAVLETQAQARDVFRECGGFSKVCELVLAYQGKAGPESSSAEVQELTFDLIRTIVGLVDAAIGAKARSTTKISEAAGLTVQGNTVVDPLSSRLSLGTPSALNCDFIRRHKFYMDFAAAIVCTSILDTDRALSVVDLCLNHVDPSLSINVDVSKVDNIRNPDAVRLVLGIIVFATPSVDNTWVDTALDLMLSLAECGGEMNKLTLPQLASCGLCSSLTNNKEFGSFLFSTSALQPRFLRLFNRLASFKMSHAEFTEFLRCVAGPVLFEPSGEQTIRLPVISSSISRKTSGGIKRQGSTVSPDDFRLSERMECLCQVASSRIETPRMQLGGDTINTLAVLLHNVPLPDRLRRAAEEGRLSFLEIEAVEESLQNEENDVSALTTSANLDVWSPLINTGFSYSVWLRHDTELGDSGAGTMHILNMSSPEGPTVSNQLSSFLSIWYDLQNQRFNVMSSASHRGEPICFPVSPLSPHSWHHILFTYSPAKRASMLARKSSLAIFVDGRPLEADVKVDSVNLPPNSKIIIGAPNPALAVSGVVRGRLPSFDFGPTLMIATVLLELDATSIFAYGPRFPGILWGDRPQRRSLIASSTCLFPMLGETGESGSIASALRRRDIGKLEGTSHVTLGHTESDDLASVAMFCTVPPESIVFAFNPASSDFKIRGEISRGSHRHLSERVVNLAQLKFSSEATSTDAILHGKAGIVSPIGFGDRLQWIGGPLVLFPLIAKAECGKVLSSALKVIHEGTRRHAPNLEVMQAAGGYRMLAVLLREKSALDEECLDNCIAFAVDGFDPSDTVGVEIPSRVNGSDRWVLSDLDAIKHVLLNHQVWDLRKQGPSVSLRLLQMLNHLVATSSVHKAFNARRIHSVGVVRWALHLMIEASDLYNASDSSSRQNAWNYEGPTVADVSVGGDPGNSFLYQCKTLLRRVLTFMLTPQDLEALAEGIVYTVSAAVNGRPTNQTENDGLMENHEKMPPIPAMRLYLVRLLEELIVDGVNEIVSSGAQPTHKRRDSMSEQAAQPQHSAGVASPDQPYLRAPSVRGRLAGGALHPKDQQAQAFLSAFANFLTPVWFATVLEGCKEEASTSAVLRLMILMLQGSSTFEATFRGSGSFAPFVLSIPRFSTSASIAITMLSQLLNLPILHLHSLPALDADQLCEIFDVEPDENEALDSYGATDPTSGIFGLIAEVLGRNIRVITADPEATAKAQHTNKAIFELLVRRHEASAMFRVYCRSPAFLEPLSQALCLIYDETTKTARPKRRSLLADVPRGLTPTERFVGGPLDASTSGVGMVRLFQMVLRDAIRSGPKAAIVVRTAFKAFPIHASPSQVEAFHLVLVEHCRLVADEVVKDGDMIALSNVIGMSSVFLEQMTSGFFTSESLLAAVKLSVGVLVSLIDASTSTISAMSSADYNLLVTHAAHFARLICVVALQTSIPDGRYDPGDDDLQAEVLAIVDERLEDLLLLPSRGKTAGRKLPSSNKSPRVSPGSKQSPLWESMSIERCSGVSRAFPDLNDIEDPEIAAIAPLLVSLHRLLIESRDDVRGLAISVFVSFLQHRPAIMSEMLVAEVVIDGEKETVDVVNRGGFRALLVAHETAAASDQSAPGATSIKRKYSAFFEWLDRNQVKVEQVFRSVEGKGLAAFPGLEKRPSSQLEAVERKQKSMLMQLTSQGDQTILGGLERTELSRRCAEKTIENHSSWRRQGVDDLAAGASCWKVALRQLKGSFSLWEGCPQNWATEDSVLTLTKCITDMKSESESVEANLQLESRLRWKLDLTEGFERQRRRLLPNYEFHGLYNIEEDAGLSDAVTNETEKENETNNEGAANADFLVGSEMEATTELLKDLNVKRASKVFDEYEEDEDDELLDSHTVSTEAETAASIGESEAENNNEETVEEEAVPQEAEDASSYDLIHGLLKSGDWPERSYNVRRCTGLEVVQGLLLWTTNAIYIIDGFEQSEVNEQTKIARVEKVKSSFKVNLRKEGAPAAEDAPRAAKKQESRPKASAESPGNDVIYQHRSQRIAFADIFCVYRRRYQLQQNALEFYDRNNNASLIAFDNNKSREELLSKVLQVDLPNSVFNSSYGVTYLSYGKFMNNWKTRIVSDWRQGKVTNFDFLMHLNSFAGRSFNDLTQYPVFPWIIADYESDELDLSDPKTYRDLSKPMGAIGDNRAKQFKDRYEALASCCTEDDPPPFHYGTHYSCAAYVLYYLMRLEPFSRMALALQGGKFDVADRLFHDVGKSWKSASSENLQDVRELIPEFFFLPDLFSNSNEFDFGNTQAGKSVHDVTLPKWAKGDPKRFVRINRQALESPIVSKQLHQWADLIFGCKQRGQEAVDSLNQFVHLTYEGEVDLDTMEDPVQRASTVAQIQNFGQTPSRLQRRPFLERTIVHEFKASTIDYGLLPGLSKLTPPFCVVGAPHAISLRPTLVETSQIGMNGQMDRYVNDIDLHKGQVVGTGNHCCLDITSKRFFRYGGINNGISIHAAAITTRQREVNKLLSVHDSLHRAPICIAKTSRGGDWLVTGSVDSTVRVWRFDDNMLSLLATLTGHDGWRIQSIDLSVEFGVLVTACERGRVLLWDLRTLTYVRCLLPGSTNESQSTVCSSINNKTGSILVVVGSALSFFDINGVLLASHKFSSTDDMPTCAIATDCPEWTEEGAAVVTGHANGEVRLWSILYDESRMSLRHLIDDNSHVNAITALRATGNERQDTLLVGDCTGKMTAFRAVSLTDSLTAQEKAMIFEK